MEQPLAVNMSIAYGMTTVAALLLVVGYSVLVRKKNVWLLLLFAAVFIVNLGYLSLSLSKTLEEALLANRISYLGSVILPLCMLMAIMGVCRVGRPKWLVGMLLLISMAVFLLAASPGYLTWYYEEASLVFVHGMAKLEKVYGPLHVVYLIYLLAYFAMMTGVIFVCIVKKRTVTHKHAAILLTVVLLNIAIWLVEQVVPSDFELLSVSYIVSELLLLMLYGMMQDYGILPEYTKEPAEQTACDGTEKTAPPVEEILRTWPAVSLLTARETDVLRAILENKKRKEIAGELYVTEHTVKKHTANIFSKLEVSSRKELFEKAKQEMDR